MASERRALVPPALIVVGGIIALGKSTVVSRLAEELSAPAIDADRTRKSLAGVKPTTRLPEQAWQGVYSAEFSERVYDDPVLRYQVGCIYTPHVVGVRARPDVAHPQQRRHAAQYPRHAKGLTTDRVFETPEVMIPFKCDVHKWMHAYAGVVDHPYFAGVSLDEGGSHAVTFSFGAE